MGIAYTGICAGTGPLVRAGSGGFNLAMIWMLIMIVIIALFVAICWATLRINEARCPVTGRIHDYKVANGGDGVPSHFHTYTCSFCGKQFEI